MHEQILPLSLREAIAYYEAVNPKGEFVLIVAGQQAGYAQQEDLAHISIEDQIAALEAQGYTRMEAIKQTARARGVPKREIYDALLACKEEEPEAHS